MEYRTCEYCGAEYPASEPKCPECGGGSTRTGETAPKRRLASSAGARAAGGKNGWRIASIVLGVLVVIGIVAFFIQMDFFREGGFDFDAIPTKIVWEDTTPAEQTPQEETPDEPVEPEPETEPEPAPGACTGLTISKDFIPLDEEGGKVFLTAVARPRDCTEPILFTSSDESVATVTENGMITAIGPGTAQILVSCGEIVEVCQVECTFEVSEPEPEEEKEPETEPETEPEEETTAPTLSKEDFTLFYPGEQYVLAVNDVPSGAAVSYVSSNTRVVTVEQDGTVTAKGEGDATITVTVGSVTLTAVARCRMDGSTEGGATGNYTDPFKISHEDVTLFSVGESFSLTLTDSTGKTVTGLSWKASNGAVTISGNTIKAATAGQTTVSCVYNGETYSCIVRCTF